MRRRFCFLALIYYGFCLTLSAETTRATDVMQSPQSNFQFVSAPNPSAIQGVMQAPPSLGSEALISLLTCSPSDDAVFTLYGHTAIRVFDPATTVDFVFGYGMFDDSKPNFIYRFAKGETDYALGVDDFNRFLIEYVMRGSEVCEQILNLLPEEKEALWQALCLNSLPENRMYRYNFFFDNCATRPVVMIENNIRGTIYYVPQDEYPAFRDVINYCTRYNSWITFGCDLVLGLPTDRTMTLRETFFIPDYLKKSFDKAEIIRNGKSEPLVIQTNILTEKTLNPDFLILFPPSPLTCFTLLFIAVLLLTLLERRKKKYYRWIDSILFFFAGMAGCVLFFLSFISVHPSIFPNMSLLWLHPLHLMGVILFSVKKFKMMAFWYHYINFAVILFMSVAWIFIPQHFNIAFIPLIASLWLRSGGALLRKKNLTG